MEIDWNYESPLYMIYDAKDTQNTPDKPINPEDPNHPIRQVPEILQQRILDPQNWMQIRQSLQKLRRQLRMTLRIMKEWTKKDGTTVYRRILALSDGMCIK